ncbi:HD-GYP domain-containing protein [Gilvimarinus sp. F26214L]|uniref:HD-GYP domain-containing protein n=1 Tax=Gilvimarinus sp. DZF01 TaxID=3461371 RepID=UPI0040460723
MAIKQVKLDVNELAIGMFISGLDRPWSQTPFPLQGFYIRDLEEIRQLKSHCRHVYIDVIKGRPPVTAPPKPTATAFGEKPKPFIRTARQSAAKVAVAPLKIRRDVYTDKEPLKREIKRAKQLHQRVYLAIGEVMTQIDGGHVPVAETRRLASEMVDSILRNPDAFSWLSRVRDVDEYTYSHAVRSAVWAILFGRHAGLPKSELDILAMGVLLKDVGKTKLDQELLRKPQRSAAEEQEYETFVELGAQILRETPGIEPRVISVVKTHRERLNGSGFPQHLSGDRIPLLGKIAGIVTYYDETTNPRGHHHPIAPSKAVARLYELRNTEFQEELVVEFIRAIGLYPTGTLVELNTGEVGVVVEQNFERRLKPKVMLVLDAVKNPLRKPLLLDLAEDERRKQELVDRGKKSPDELENIEIAQDLEPGTYEVNIAQIRDEYLFSNAPVAVAEVAGKRGLLSILGFNR